MTAATRREEEAAERAITEAEAEAAAAEAEAEAKAAEKAARVAAKKAANESFEKKVQRRRSSTKLTVSAAASAAEEAATSPPPAPALPSTSKDEEMRSKFAALEKRYGKAMSKKEKKLREAFAIFDTDGDGHLSVDGERMSFERADAGHLASAHICRTDLRSANGGIRARVSLPTELAAILIRPGGGNTFTMEMVKSLVADFDTNGDGVLQFEEFSPLWESVTGDSGDA